MDLGNLLKDIVCYLPIGGWLVLIIRMSFQWWVYYYIWLPLNITFKESWLMAIWLPWLLKPTMLHDLSTLREYCTSYEVINYLTYGWDPELSYIPYGLGNQWLRQMTTKILGRSTMISHRLEIVCLFEWSLKKMGTFLRKILTFF